MASQVNSTQEHNLRPTIGLFITSFENEQAYDVWSGAYDAAQALGANLMCFPIGWTAFNSWPQVTDNRSVLGTLVNPHALDGMLVFHFWQTREKFTQFYESFSPLPVVNVMRLYSGYPGVAIDSYQDALLQARHLTNTHQCRRIAYVKNHQDHVTSDARYQAYLDALSEAGIEFDPRLVVPQDRFQSAPLGPAVVSYLTDELSLDLQSDDLDAILTFNDDYGLQVMRALTERGIHVPHNLVLVGIDNLPEAQISSPPLTTVDVPRQEMGYRALELLLAKINGEAIPEETIIPGRLIVRRSCGCVSAQAVRAGLLPSDVELVNVPFVESWSAKREQILGDLAQLCENNGKESLWTRDLLDAFAVELTTDPPDQFLSNLDVLLEQSLLKVQEVDLWNDAISLLRQHLYVTIQETDDGSQFAQRAESLWTQARIAVTQRERILTARLATQAAQKAADLRGVGQSLLTTTSMNAVLDMFVSSLPQLGIEACYLALYQDPSLPASGADLILANDHNGRLELESGAFLAPPELLPLDLLNERHDKPYSLLLEPLYTPEQQLGYALLGTGAFENSVYDVLRVQMSSALANSMNIQEREQVAYELEQRAELLQAVADVSTAVSSILDPDELIQQIVTAVQVRFGLYYAGVFLVDDTGQWTGEPRRWAVLRAGTGAAGRQMMQEGHKLEIQGDSMIGQCITSGQADIQLQVGEETVRFVNPLLPDTRSEMALPLVSRGQVLGALTIQSAEQEAFTQQDIVVLQSMANQVANALANTRLVEATQARVHEMQILDQFTSSVSSSLELEDALDAAVRTLSQEMGFTYIAINVIDRQLDQLRTLRGFGLAASLQGMARSLGELTDDILMDIASKGEIEVIDGWDDRFDREIFTQSGHADLIRAYVPMMVREQAVGILEVGYHRQQQSAITDDEVRLLSGIGDRISVAIENARLLQQTQQRAAQESLISEISTRMQQATDMESLMRITAQELSRVLDAPRVYVRLESPGSGNPAKGR